LSGHLIHIGYPKAGSTLLQLWFRRHPQLAYAGLGIAGFTSILDLVACSVAPEPNVRYRVTSSEALTTPHARSADTEPASLAERLRGMREAQARACRTLADLFPNAHILLVTRGFRSIIFSGYSQYLREGGGADFDPRLAAGLDMADSAPPIWNYDYVVRLYREAFGDRLIVLPFELLREDADAFVGELEGRLGLDHFPAPQERANPSFSPIELYWYPRLSRFARRLPVGTRLRGALLRRYRSAVGNNRLRRPIALLQRLRPGQPVTSELISDEVLSQFRAQAEILRGEPHYARYAEDYLL
jgi:hypothetical protein